MKVVMSSLFGVVPSYKVECKQSTDSLVFYKALVEDAVFAGESFTDFFSKSRLSTLSAKLNNQWFNTIKLRSRIMKQYADPDSIAKTIDCTLPEAALLQLIYAKAGLVSYADDYCVHHIVKNGENKIGEVLSGSELCSAISYAEFYGYVWHDELSKLLVDCANAVKAGMNGPLIGSQAPAAITARISAFEFRLKEAAAGGFLGRSFDEGIIYDCAYRVIAYSIAGTEGFGIEQSSATDAYALCQNDVSTILQYANFYDHLDVTKILSDRAKQALPGAVSRLAYGLGVLERLGLFTVQEVSAACADILPLNVIHIGNAKQIRPFIMNNFTASRHVAEAMPTVFGFQLSTSPEVDSKLFAANAVEENEAAKIVTTLERVEEQFNELLPLLSVTYMDSLRDGVLQIPEVMKIAFCVGNGKVIVVDDTIVYSFAFASELYSGVSALSMTTKAGQVYTPDLNCAFLYACLLAEGPIPDVSYRDVYGGTANSPTDVQSLDLAKKAMEIGHGVVSVGAFSFNLPVPGSEAGRTVTEEDFLRPVGLYRRKYGYYADPRINGWIKNYTSYLTKLVSMPEMYDSADGLLIEWFIGYEKRAKTYFGDRVKAHFESLYGTLKPDESVTERVARSRCVVRGAVNAYTEMLRLVYPDSALIIDKLTTLAVLAAKRNNIDLVGRAI